ncbi:MAG: DUF1801 domain-containing protein [Candidatus Eremiobacteraeota bacterium]|nr:DUF1801 domain-containing protein [Candidatus Eremiobacteraeota bacterium]
MASPTFKSVDAYIASHPEPMQNVLKELRNTIRKALPRAQELISYSMPTYKIDDVTVLHFAGWTRHYSLYAATDHVVAAFKEELAPYKTEKGTIRFPLSQPVPKQLIERIVKFRAKVAGHES